MFFYRLGVYTPVSLTHIRNKRLCSYNEPYTIYMLITIELTSIQSILYSILMPQVTVYVSKEDLPKWKAIEKKAEFIRKALLGTPDTYLLSTKLAKENPEIVKSFDKVAEPFVPRPPDPETGYPCCEKVRPCKHWQWNPIDSVWVNELTGKTKDATV